MKGCIRAEHTPKPQATAMTAGAQVIIAIAGMPTGETSHFVVELIALNPEVGRRGW